MPVTLDMFEYPTDAAAQAAYPSSDDYGVDIVPTMTDWNAPEPYIITVSSTNADNYCWKAFDNNTATKWLGSLSGVEWLKIDLGAANAARIEKYTIMSGESGQLNRNPQDWTLEGSNNDVDWTVVDTRTTEDFGVNETKTYVCNGTLGTFRYYKLNITANHGAVYTAIYEMELMKLHLQCYSESTIVIEGTYSLKVIARATDSLNDTLTRTIGTPIDLSDLTKIKFDIIASRTGTNLKVRIRDSGGTWSEYSIAISSANTWETKEWDISGVSNANKDAIDRIEFEIIEASADNTFYLDNMLANWWTKIFTEQIVLSDSFSRRWSIYRTFTETLQLTDSVSKKVSKIFSEAITLTDTIKKKVGKVFTENISLTDTFSRVWHIYRTFTENITLTDTISKKISKIFTETLHLQDTFSRVWHIYRTFTEKISLTDKVKMVKTNLVNLIKKLIHLEDIED